MRTILGLLLTIATLGVANGQNIQIPPPATPPMGTPSVGTPSVGTPFSPAEAPVIPGPLASPATTQPIMPPGPTWDPYAPPGTLPPPPLIPDSAFATAPIIGTGTVAIPMQRFLSELRLDYYYLASRGSKKFGVNTLDLSATFAFPFLWNPETPIKVTPGFTFNWWEGPTGSGIPNGTILDYLPPRVYDAYLSTGWTPQLNSYIGGDLGVTVGAYSDMRKVSTESIRVTGHGLFILSINDKFQVKAGMAYYDRVRVKIMPAGGVVWSPNADTRFDILFPNPMIARRLISTGTAEWWLYCRGEYGGGSWFVAPSGGPGDAEMIDYNDIRVSLGLECNRENRLSGMVELGISCARELIAKETWTVYHPSTTLFIRAGLVY